jgi:two-component system LytT family response regulator
MSEDQKYKVLIVDDEAPARNIIKVFLQKETDVELIDEATDGFDAVKKINLLKPDLVFLDIQMPKLTGFELLELLETKPEIVFVTAYDQFAVKAFELNAVDYILKPFNKERFHTALAKALERLKSDTRKGESAEKLIAYSQQTTENLQRIALKKGNQITVMDVENIFYIEAQDDYTMIYTQNERFLKHATMQFFEDKLDKDLFIRTHRSYIVNLKHIEKIELFEKDTRVVVMKNKAHVKVGRNGYTILKEKLSL